jgi:hypothetical protein
LHHHHHHHHHHHAEQRLIVSLHDMDLFIDRQNAVMGLLEPHMKHEERSKECSRKIAFKSIMLAVAETKFVGSDMDENIESFVEQMKLSGLSVRGWMDGWVDSIHRLIV